MKSPRKPEAKRTPFVETVRARLIASALLAVFSALFAVGLDNRTSRAAAVPMNAPELALEMATAATNFLRSLRPGQKATYLFKDHERLNFHFFPVPRRGLAFKDMNSAQRQLSHALLSTGMSHRGYAKAMTIMSLGQILRDEAGEAQNVHRDSDQYHVTIFGEPEGEKPWGWRIEGFHLSMNFTIVAGRWISFAPSFFGSIPATVADGPHKGLQVLRQEEEWARRLARSFDAEQRHVAFGPVPIFEDTVGGFITGNTPRIERGKPRGLPVSKMTPEQSKLLMEIVRMYAHRHRHQLAEAELSKVERAGTENIHFAWGGSREKGEPHHYLIQGPTFLIEYDNTQDDANHVHCIWRDFDNDFGRDMLRRHYALHHRE